MAENFLDSFVSQNKPLMAADGVRDWLGDGDNLALAREPRLVLVVATENSDLGDVMRHILFSSRTKGPEMPQAVVVSDDHRQEEVGLIGDQGWAPLAASLEVVFSDEAVGRVAAYRGRKVDLALPLVVILQEMVLQFAEKIGSPSKL